MVAVKHKIEMALDEDLFHSLERFAKATQQTVPAIGAELIEIAVQERLEDLHFSKQADERLQKNPRRFSHAEVWDDLSG